MENKTWQALSEHWRELSDLGGVSSLLGWDQSTYLPGAAAAGRARQQALLSRIRHERATSAEYGRLLDAAENAADLGEVQRRAVAVARRNFERAQRLPARLVGELSAHAGETYSAWVKARPEGDFKGLVPRLERTLELSLETAGYFPEFAEPLDFFIDESDEGMSAASVAALFEDLRRELVPLVERVLATPEPRTDFLHRDFAPDKQLEFGERVIRDYGYDFARGRQDLTAHPFMTRMGDDDLRITTRVKERDLTEALYSTLHESGHAMYEQGVGREHLGTPLGGGVSAGVHESQSRLWENQVGRSRAFWTAYFGDLQAAFPEQLADVSAEEMYRASNAVRRSLIRTDADELTYNLHVIIRFGLERQMLQGELKIADLADAWQAAYRENLGLEAPSHTDGVLQDVHWFWGIGGAFQGYTLGNVMSAQFFAAAREAGAVSDAHVARREFAPLLGWLGENVYAHGGRYLPEDLLRRVTGEGLSAAPYLEYLRGKYGELYGL